MKQDPEVRISLRVAELLCSRLCHDLISPTSAVNTGLELMHESDPEIAGKAMDLIRDSAAQGARKLDFFRLAFGFGDGGSKITVADALALFVGYSDERRVKVNWDNAAPEAGLSLSKPASRLLVNLLMVAADCLPRGGNVDLAFVRIDKGLAIAASAAGTGAALSPDRAQALNPNADETMLNPRTVQTFFATKQAEALSAPLEIDEEIAECVRFATVLPV